MPGYPKEFEADDDAVPLFLNPDHAPAALEGGAILLADRDVELLPKLDRLLEDDANPATAHVQRPALDTRPGAALEADALRHLSAGAPPPHSVGPLYGRYAHRGSQVSTNFHGVFHGSSLESESEKRVGSTVLQGLGPLHGESTSRANTARNRAEIVPRPSVRVNGVLLLNLSFNPPCSWSYRRAHLQDGAPRPRSLPSSHPRRDPFSRSPLSRQVKGSHLYPLRPLDAVSPIADYFSVGGTSRLVRTTGTKIRERRCRLPNS